MRTTKLSPDGLSGCSLTLVQDIIEHARVIRDSVCPLPLIQGRIANDTSLSHHNSRISPDEAMVALRNTNWLWRVAAPYAELNLVCGDVAPCLGGSRARSPRASGRHGDAD